MTGLIPFDGVYYCPYTGLKHCIAYKEDECIEWAECPIRIAEEETGTVAEPDYFIVRRRKND